MSDEAPPLVMDLQGRVLQEDELERFAEEVLKYDELTKPHNASQSMARRKAMKQLGTSFNISDPREMTRQLMRFRQLCINKMRWLIRVSQARYGTGSDALLIAPAWLRRLDRCYNLMINALKMECLHGGPQSANGARMARFTLELYSSVRAALATSGDAAALLYESAAVEPFARRTDLPLDTVHGIWMRMYNAALDKLRLYSRGGDLLARARPSPLEWRVIDLALLHDTGQTTLAKDSFSNSLEVEAMLQLYKLITEAHNKVDRHKQNTLLKPRNVTQNTQNEQTSTTDPTKIGTTANSFTRQDPVPSCSSGASEGTESVAQKYPLLVSQLLQSPPEWESAEIWTIVHAEYNKRGRVASLVTLQRRWYELRLLARRDLLLSFRDHKQKIHPLLLAIVKRFPHVVTSPLALWPHLVRERRVHTHELAEDASCTDAPTEATPTDVPSTVSMSDVMTDLLEWSDDEPEIIEPDKEVIEIDSDNEADANADNTKQDDQNPRLKAIKTEPKDDDNPNIPQGNTKTTDDIAKTKETGNSSEETANIMLSEIIDKYIDTSRIELTKNIQTPHRNMSLTGLNTSAVESEKDSCNSVNQGKIADSLEVKEESNSQAGKIRIMFEDDGLNTSAVESEKDSCNSVNQGNAKIADSLEVKEESNSQAGKIRIMFEDDSDLNEIENYFANLDDDALNALDDENTSNSVIKSEKQLLSENKSESDPKVKSEPDEIENHLSANEHTDKQNKSSNNNARLSSLSLKRKLVDNYYKKVPHDCFKNIASKDTNSKGAVSGDREASASTEVDSDSNNDKSSDSDKHSDSDKCSDNDKHSDSDKYSDNDKRSDSDKCSDVGNARNSIDEKLLMLSRVVLTPVEHIPEWGKHSRNGAVCCRQFSVKRFAAHVHVTARELNACRRYVPVRAESQPPACQPEASPAAGASGTGIARDKMDEMRNIPPAYKVMKRKLSRLLRLPRTWLSGAFWANARNVAQLCVCDPLSVSVRRLAHRPVKKVELADIAEVRMRNSTILTAQVAPISLESPADGNAPPTPEPSQEAASGVGHDADEAPAEGSEALPSQEDLMRMIRTLVHPSIAALREADAEARARLDSDAAARAAHYEAQLRSQRDTRQHLDDDIQNLIHHYHTYDVPEKPKKTVSSKIKKVQPKHKGVIAEDDIPLPDAFQEWERQKTLIHKYFSFNNPTREPDAKTQSKKPGPKNRTSKVRTSVSKVSDTSKNKIDLMAISDDEDVSKNCDNLAGDKSTNNKKRPREGSDNTTKRVKLTEDQPNDTTAKKNEDNNSSDSDNDGDRMIIDEGIRDIDDPVFSTGSSTDGVDRESLKDSLSTPNTQQTQPKNLRLTIMPVDSVPGLHSDHDMPSNIVYVVKTHKNDNVVKTHKNDNVVKTHKNDNDVKTHKNDNEPKKAAIPTSSAVNSIKLPGDASLTMNTPVTTSISTKLPTYYFIASGKQVKGNSEFKVVSGPPLRKIIPKTTPMNVINTSDSIETLAEQKFTYPTNTIRMTRPGPLSAKHRISTQILKAMSDKINKWNPEKSSEQIPKPQIVEEIDLTDETEVDLATGPKIVSISSLKNIKKENDVVNPWTDGDDNSNKVVNKYEDLIDPTKLPNITSVSKGQMLSLEVGPITSSINKRVYSNTTKVMPETNANNKQSSVNLTFILNKNSTSNKRKEVAETICLDSEASDENETLDCTSIKQERDVDVDASSNDSESRDVDVESEAPSAPNAVIHKAKSSIDEVLSIVKTEKESPIKSSTFQTTSSETTPQNKNTSKSLLKPIAQNEISSQSLLKTSSQNQDTGRSLLKTTSQNPEKSKGLPKTTSRNLETSKKVLKSTTQNQEPNASSQTKDTDNIPIKITNTTTSKDLLKLSPEELARLLEDDNVEEIIEYAQPQVPQNKVATQSIAPVQKKVQNIAPIKIKKEKQWAEEMQLSKEKELTTPGVVVKQEGGSGRESQPGETNLELLLQDVPSVSELRTALPDVICGDVQPSDGGETPYFESVADLGKRKIDLADYVSKVTDPEEALLKLDFSEPIWLLAGKYLLLTDENIPHVTAAYLSSAGGAEGAGSGGGGVAPYTEIRFPDVRNKQVLNLGLKKGEPGRDGVRLRGQRRVRAVCEHRGRRRESARVRDLQAQVHQAVSQVRSRPQARARQDILDQAASVPQDRRRAAQVRGGRHAAPLRRVQGRRAVRGPTGRARHQRQVLRESARRAAHVRARAERGADCGALRGAGAARGGAVRAQRAHGAATARAVSRGRGVRGVQRGRAHSYTQDGPRRSGLVVPPQDRHPTALMHRYIGLEVVHITRSAIS